MAKYRERGNLSLLQDTDNSFDHPCVFTLYGNELLIVNFFQNAGVEVDDFRDVGTRVN